MDDLRICVTVCGQKRPFAVKMSSKEKILDLKNLILGQVGLKISASDLKLLNMGKVIADSDLTLEQANIGFDSSVQVTFIGLFGGMEKRVNDETAAFQQKNPGKFNQRNIMTFML